VTKYFLYYEKKVVAHDTDLNNVLTTTQASGLKSPVVKFIEKGIRVYKYFTRVSKEL